MNRVTVMGRLGRDPEVRQLPGGGTVVQLSVATSERRKGADGQYTEYTEWHRVSVFRQTAEFIAKFGAKGRRVLVEGALRTQQWEKNGEKRYTTEIVARSVDLIDWPEKEDGRSVPAANPGRPAGKAVQQAPVDDFDDDIPF